MASVWRHRWLVLATVALTMLLAIGFELVGPDEVTYEATANVVIQEPLTSEENTVAGVTSNQQYISTQLEIIRSPVVAEAAAELVNEEGFEVSADDLVEAVTIVATAESPLVTITARAPDADIAAAFANGMAEGYREVTQRQTTATSEAQLERIDAQVAVIDQRLAEIGDELSTLISNQPALETLRLQAQESIGIIANLQADLLEATGDEADTIRLQIADHRQRILVYSEIAANSTVTPEQQALVEEQTRQIERRATLLTLRDQVAVDVGLAPDAIALVQPATNAEGVAGFGLARVVAVALIVGLALGGVIAYLLDASRKTLTRRSEPEQILGTRMLADVPDFDLESLESVVPVRDHPRSAAAEAYRFAATSVAAGARAHDIKSILVVSATLGHGKTTTVVNMAIAAAVHGRRVLVLDCDFGNQESSRLLLGDTHMRDPGVTDVIDGTAALREAAHRVDLGDGTWIWVMPRGTRPTLAASAFQSAEARRLFDDVVAGFDLIVVDGPPLLQVAYASILAELVQGLVVVAEHGGRQSELVDLKDRLELIGTPVLGYVYNRSPLRREMTMSEGSMMDILGDSGLEPEVEEVRPTRFG